MVFVVAGFLFLVKMEQTGGIGGLLMGIVALYVFFSLLLPSK
jgi:hypothetical protein